MIRRMRLKITLLTCVLMMSVQVIHASPQATESPNQTLIGPGTTNVNLSPPSLRRIPARRPAHTTPTTLMSPVMDDDSVVGKAASSALTTRPQLTSKTPGTIGDLAAPVNGLPYEVAAPGVAPQGFDSIGSLSMPHSAPLTSPAGSYVGAPYAGELYGADPLPVNPAGQSLYNGKVFSGSGGNLELLTPYMSRARGYENEAQPLNVRPAPGSFVPWWSAKMLSSLRQGSSPLSVTLDQLTVQALQYSPRIQAIKVDPQIRLQTVVEEDAEFDWNAFVDTTWDDTSEPVGSTLTTGAGGPSRFRDHQFASTGGVRRRTRNGGELEISQRLGFQDNNSQFFLPTQQGTARLELNYTHPLARESGRVYNQSRIVLAQIEEGVSRDRVVEDVQLHLIDVSRAFWQLYRARAVYLQKTKLLESAEKIQGMLEGRQLVDSVRRQVLRSRAAVASRKAELARASMEIRNSESRLRQLVNHPGLISAGHVEMLPNANPVAQQIPLTVSESLEIALQNRPDIAESLKSIRAMSVRLGVAKNDLRPRLDLVVGAYLSGLEGGSDINLAWGNQFTEGEPSYSLGLLFEVPLGNRAAQARFRKRELEVHQALQEFKATVEAGITDVEVAVREADTTFKEIQSRYHAMQAAEKETDYLSERWKLLPGNDRTTSFLLEDLLDAQERAAQEQLDYVSAQVNYMLAIADVKRATGTLLQTHGDVQFAQNVQLAPQPLPTDALPVPMEGNNLPLPMP